MPRHSSPTFATAQAVSQTPGPHAPRTTTAGRMKLGRSGPRSRSGCVTCKQRRVRCDETHPVCGHCSRLQLNCHYKPHRDRETLSRARRCSSSSNQDQRSPPGADSTAIQGGHNLRRDTNIDYLSLVSSRRQTNSTPILGSTNAFDRRPQSSSGQATPNQLLCASWAQGRSTDFNDIFLDLHTSWAGEFSALFPDIESPGYSLRLAHEPSDALVAVDGIHDISASPVRVGEHRQTSFNPSHSPEKGLAECRSVTQQPETDNIDIGLSNGLAPRRASNDQSAHLIQLFRRISQPPAAILIGGSERWRRLQHYLCKMSDQSQAVHNALLSVIEFLEIEETMSKQHQSRDVCMSRILERHALACDEIRTKLSMTTALKPKTREYMLATIFLLSWFEVIRDQDASSSLFPRDLADIVISNDVAWSRYSRQLLSWLNTLDSKATHLGGEHLLSPQALNVVSHYPTQITSSLERGYNSKPFECDEASDISLSDLSPGSSHHSPEELNSNDTMLQLGQVKQIMLNTILQPTLEWYLASQAYCRRISAHDKHHRKRFTSDDEYEVITACKHLESELFELWDSRPAVISFSADQLTQVVSPDIAIRLEEIFSVYLASFWILFVYLHRVSWWDYPHSAVSTRALDEVWSHMRRAYGEEVSSPLCKVIHPSLLWPLFLFGSECADAIRRSWAVEQLEALGEAKSIHQSEAAQSSSLPAFKLSSGATRNAKRAAALLRELIKEQDMKQARVDDRDLSMRMFGCYFSIV